MPFFFCKAIVVTVLSVSQWHECAAMQWKSCLKEPVAAVYLTIPMAESEAMEAIQENGKQMDWVSCRDESAFQLLKANFKIVQKAVG